MSTCAGGQRPDQARRRGFLQRLRDRVGGRIRPCVRRGGVRRASGCLATPRTRGAGDRWVTSNMLEMRRRTVEVTPQPRLVIAVGDCARNRGVFADACGVARAAADARPACLPAAMSNGWQMPWQAPSAAREWRRAMDDRRSARSPRYEQRALTCGDAEVRAPWSWTGVHKVFRNVGAEAAAVSSNRTCSAGQRLGGVEDLNRSGREGCGSVSMSQGVQAVTGGVTCRSWPARPCGRSG